MQKPLRFGAGPLVLAAAALILSGCAAQTSPLRPGAMPEPASSPSASTPATPAMPSCDQLTSVAAVGSLFGHDVVAIGAHLLDLGQARTGYLLESVGGVSCAWGDPATLGSGAAEFQGLVIEVLPHAAAAWDTLAGWYPATSTPGAPYGDFPSRGGNCDDGARISFCQANVLAGENWITVTATSATPSFTQATFREAAEQMTAGLRDVLATPKSTVPVIGPPTCASERYEDAVASSFATPIAAYRAPENIFRIEAAAAQAADLQSCSYVDAADGSGHPVVSLAVVPNAAKQLAEFRALLRAQGIATDTVPIGSGDAAATGRSYSSSGTVRYVLDFEWGGSWVTISTRDTAPARAHAADFAGWIVASG
ncbi:MAG TPA: hypothetical protein VIQ26_05155, partial [Microbacteriaceae bacterium]